MKYDYLIVGAGLFGSVFAQQALAHGKRVLIVDKRDHIAGNIYTQEIERINVHKWGLSTLRNAILTRSRFLVLRLVTSHCLQNKQSVKFSINSAFFIEMCYNKCKKKIKSNKKACT